VGESKIIGEVKNDAQSLGDVFHTSYPTLQDENEKFIHFCIKYSEIGLSLLYKSGPTAEWVCLVDLDALKMSDLDFVGPVVGAFAVAGPTAEPTSVKFSDFNVE
jgi:hypothetical protein